MRGDTTNFRELFLGDLPLLDVRAPIEFHKGAFPQAVNLPLMTDAERHEVGIRYKRQGQAAALALGHSLVADEVRAARLAGWMAFAAANPKGYVYCFRGGLRSSIVQQWLNEAGVAYPKVAGGYKAMRQFLIDQLEQAAAECKLMVLGGMTGTGKTDVLQQVPYGLDLEGHAHHRGSSFGKHALGQPVQIDFENRLSIDILKKRAAGYEGLVLEDESRMIGSCSLPLPLYQAMQHAPIVWLEDSFDQRVERILRDYVVDLCAEYTGLFGEDAGFEQFAQRLRCSLDKLVRRLGAERHQRLAALMDAALLSQSRRGAIDAHRAWISALLSEYYDPMYVYQRGLKASRIVLVGSRHEVLQALRENALPAWHRAPNRSVS
ncbi:MAG TPA: tRNA 2-selenouridine(34) synthase MnmH [Pusillimonas sp.]|uniref:tRNA 2-selenouridine(34) synthase MnmH n=1 Tax=Pusillimonas sp. TaxID=3040095 RepID=UPI002CFF2EB0|nr:tRNA 2-selenouridine(34) synthase MnmH [Pusillimonas sp.]HUH87229.1 tRNA 2-selenouridine(34) synthase MnmH [Pusillimonas sp.]